MAQSALGEAHALRKLLIKFGSKLHEEGRSDSDIETALQIMGGESGPTPLPPSRPYYQQLADACLVESYNAASAAEATQIDIADTWHVGSDPFCAYFLAQGPELWMQTGAPPQRSIPRSCEHLVQSHLIWLFECSQTTQLTRAQQLGKATQGIATPQAASAASLVTQLVEQYLRGETPSAATDLLNIALIIPLSKNETGGIRPVSIPTVFRKLAATVCILEYATQISQYVGASQHGAAMSSGATVMAERVDLLIAMDPQR
eukprot:1523257-Amphidinium_carterae.2